MWNFKYALKSTSFLAVFLFISITPARAAGLPQLDFATFPSQLIWLVITFAVLLLLMTRVSLPRISETLAERQHKIDDNLKKAESYKEEAEIAAATYTRSQAEARADAYAIIMKTRSRISDDIATKKAELDEELESEIKSAEERISYAKEIAMASIADLATEVAITTTEKISGESLSKKEAGTFIAEVLKDRQ